MLQQNPFEIEVVTEEVPLIVKPVEKTSAKSLTKKIALGFLILAASAVFISTLFAAGTKRHHTGVTKDDGKFSYHILLHSDGLPTDMEELLEELKVECCAVSKKKFGCQNGNFTLFCGSECIESCAEYSADAKLSSAEGKVVGQLKDFIADKTSLDSIEQDLYDEFATLKGKIGDLSYVDEIVDDLTEKVEDLEAAVGAKVDDVGEQAGVHARRAAKATVAKAQDTVDGAVQTVGDGIADAAYHLAEGPDEDAEITPTEIGDAIKEAADAVYDNADDVAYVVAGVVSEAVENVGEGVKDIAYQVLDGADDAAVDVAAKVDDAVYHIGEGVSDVAYHAAGVVKEVAAEVYDNAEDIAYDISEAIDDAADHLKATPEEDTDYYEAEEIDTDKVSEAIKEAADVVYENADDVVYAAAGVVSEAVETVGEGVKDVAYHVADGADEAAADVAAKVDDVVYHINEGVADVSEHVAEAAKEVAAAVYDNADDIANDIGEAIQQAADTVYENVDAEDVAVAGVAPESKEADGDSETEDDTTATESAEEEEVEGTEESEEETTEEATEEEATEEETDEEETEEETSERRRRLFAEISQKMGSTKCRIGWGVDCRPASQMCSIDIDC